MHRNHRARAWALATGVVLVAMGYATLLPSIKQDLENIERHFGDTAADGVPHLGLYAEVVSVDSVAETIHLRLHVAPNRTLQGGHPNTPGRDLTVRIADGDAVHEVALHANEPMPPVAVEATLSGSSIALYPVERFQAALNITAREGLLPPGSPAPAVPVDVTVWEAIGGWTVGSSEEPGGVPGEVRLRLNARRTGALAFLALALYAIMVLIGGAALTIGGLVFLRVRKVEATLAGFLSGMLFALPAMRYALPGGPPLGVRADLLVFLWAELAVAVGLLLFVLAWAMDGPRQ